MSAARFASHQVVTGDHDGPRPLTLHVEGGRITEVRDGVEPGAEPLDGVVVPGFVDTHCHGAAGADFTDPDLDRVMAAIGHHRRHGTTSLVASTVTTSMDELCEQLRRLRPLVADGELAGVHVEGPFLSPAHKGAHPEELLVHPTPDAIGAVLEAGGPALRMVTVAPELPGGLEAVHRLRAAGVVVAFGHSDADAATTRQAVDEGVGVATHLFNAMRPVHHRAPGPVPVLLDDDRVTVEVIADLVHLDVELLRLVPRAAGTSRVSLVTDAMSATGSPDGRYLLGRLAVQVTGGVARLVTEDGSQGAIAGSTLTMDVAVRNVLAAGWPLAEAVRMASVNPARALRLPGAGRLEPGCHADLCLLDTDRPGLVRVMRRGRWIGED